MFNILIIIFMKKRNLFILPCIAAVAIATFVAKKTFETNAFKTNSLLMLNVEALSKTESAGGCKWKIIDCPGWFTGDYEACLENGDGNSCTCGQVTRECKDD